MKKTLAIITTIFLMSCEQEQKGDWKVAASDPELLHGSVTQVTNVIVHDIFSPPVASRIYAYMSIAGYEAAIPEDPKYRSFAGQLTGLEALPQPEKGAEYCYPLASVQAMLKVGRTLVFSEDKMDVYYDSIMQRFRDTGMPREVFDRSVAFGTKVA